MSQGNTFLHIGDIVSLYADGGAHGLDVSGFMATMGCVDDRCIVVPTDGTPDDPPSRFRDCLYRVCITNRYAAQKQYWTEQKEQHKHLAGGEVGNFDEEMLRRLQTAAEKEIEQNEEEYQRSLGKEVQYGMTIQLLHMKTKKFITVRKREPAKVERNAMRIVLDKDGNEGSYFVIEPSYKHCSLGDNVVVGDRVCFVPAAAVATPQNHTKDQLHVSPLSLPDREDAREVNCQNEPTSWQVLLYLQFNETNPDILKSGDVVRLFHADQQAFLTCKSRAQENLVFLRLTGRQNTINATSSQALWQVQVVTDDPVRGGPAKWDKHVRFKHLATGTYLCIEEEKEAPPTPFSSEPSSLDDQPMPLAHTKRHTFSSSAGKTMSRSRPSRLPNQRTVHSFPMGRNYRLIPANTDRENNFIQFGLDPCTLTKCDAFVPRQPFVRLFSVTTGAWVHSTDPDVPDNLYRKDKSEKGWVKVVCRDIKEDKEAFEIRPVDPDEVRDLDFANDASKAFSDFIEKVEHGDSVHKDKGFINKLLADCIRFVSGSNNALADPLRMTVANPRRDRQKLIREQEVLTQIFKLLEVPFRRRHNEEKEALFDSPRELSKSGNEPFKMMFQLAYTLLKNSQVDYRKNQEYLAGNFASIQKQIGFDVMAEDTMTAVLHNNPDILETFVQDTHILQFVKLVRNNQAGKFLDYLADLCVCRGEANKKIQEKICTNVLKEANRDILMFTEQRVLDDNTMEVFIGWPGDGKGQSLVGVCVNRHLADQQRVYEYYLHQLNLLAQMCQDQQYLAISPPAERKLLNISVVLPPDLVLACMGDTRLPLELRACFTRLMRHLHVVRGSTLAAVCHARLWKDISDCVSLECYRVQSDDVTANRLASAENDPVFGAIRQFVDDFFQDLIVSAEPDAPVLQPLAKNLDKNSLISEVVKLARCLATFGYYSFSELIRLAHSLLAIADCVSPSARQQMQQPQRPNPKRSISEALRQSLTPNLIAAATGAYGAEFIRSAERTAAASAAGVRRAATVMKQASLTLNSYGNTPIGDKELNDIAFQVQRAEDSKHLILKTKSTIAELLQFIMDVRRDYRISLALSWFKQRFPCDADGEIIDVDDDRFYGLDESAIENSLVKTVMEHNYDELEFDLDNGRQFLRILLQMCMTDYAPLTSLVLKLLFRYFNQYQELVDDLKQIQLLVTEEDVKNYNQIKRDLYLLKHLTDKSELWVWGSRGQEANDDNGNDRESPGPEPLDRRRSTVDSDKTSAMQSHQGEATTKRILEQLDYSYPLTSNASYKLVLEILGRMTDLCALKAPSVVASHALLGGDVFEIEGDQQPDRVGGGGGPRGVDRDRSDRNQRCLLLRNVHVHDTVINFLSIPYDKKNDKQMEALRLAAHEFLRKFCHGNRDNQLILHRAIKLGNDTREGVLRVQTVDDVQTLQFVFMNNRELCQNVPEELVAHIVSLIEHQERDARFLETLQHMVVVHKDKEPLLQTQELVVQELLAASDEVCQFYSDNAGFEQLVALMQQCRPDDLDDPRHPLKYHIELVRLWAECTRGTNVNTELKCAPKLPMEHIVKVITDKSCLHEVKAAYLTFMLYCYIETDAEIKDAYNVEYVERILNNILVDVRQLTDERNGRRHNVSLETYVCQAVTEMLNKFFEKPLSDTCLDIHDHHLTFERLLHSFVSLSQTYTYSRTNNALLVDNCAKKLGTFAEEQNIPLADNIRSSALWRKMQSAKVMLGAQKNASQRRVHSRYQAVMRCSPFGRASTVDSDNVANRFHVLVADFEQYVRPLQWAECSVLVDVLHTPEHLFLPHSPLWYKCRDGAVVHKLITHCKLLLKQQQEQLCIRVLQTLCRMAKVKRKDFGPEGEDKRAELLRRYFKCRLGGQQQPQPDSGGLVASTEIPAQECESDSELLRAVQCKLNRAGAADLVVDLVMCDPSHEVLLRTIELAKALLLEGNGQVQSSFYKRLGKVAEKFLWVIQSKLQTAQNRLKADMLAAGDSAAHKQPAWASWRPSPASSRRTSNNPSPSRNSPIPTPRPGTSESSYVIRSESSVADMRSHRSNSRRTIAVNANDAAAAVADAQDGSELNNNTLDTLDAAPDLKRRRSALPAVNINTSGGSFTEYDLQAGRSSQRQRRPNSLYIDAATMNETVVGSVTDYEFETMASGQDVQSAVGQQGALPHELLICEPLLRFLQLLCENHNKKLQNFVRDQQLRTNYNLVAEVLTFLDTICGSTKGSLGVFREITPHNFTLINQTLATLIEFCQGPCHENQNTIVTHECHGLNIVISLVLNEIRPLADQHMKLALELKSQASKLLLAVMESRDDSLNAERVIGNMLQTASGPKQLVAAVVDAYKMQTSEMYEVTKWNERYNRDGQQQLLMPTIAIDRPQSQDAHAKHTVEEEVSELVNPQVVGHNIYILAYQLSRYNTELADQLLPDSHSDEPSRAALTYYKQHTATIEIVRSDRSMERVVFPIHDICNYLTSETKQRVFLKTSRDSQGSKVSHFVAQWPDLYAEMNWQKKLEELHYFRQCTKRFRLWNNMSTLYTVAINLLVVLFYPFQTASYEALQQHVPLLLVLCTLSMMFVYSVWDHKSWLTGDWLSADSTGVSATLTCLLLLLITLAGAPTAVTVLGLIQLLNAVIIISSHVGNTGLMNRSWSDIAADRPLWYHCGYFAVCLIGLQHNLIYCLLLWDVVVNDETLRNVIRSVTHNWQSVVMTGLLALILVYHFSIFGYLHFREDFVADFEPGSSSAMMSRDVTGEQTCDAHEPSCQPASAEPPDTSYNSCESVRMCMLFVLNWGLRSGGGVGDVLRKRSPDEEGFLLRFAFDEAFYVIVIVVVINLVFGVIIDSFGDLRTEKNEAEDILKNTCFICGLHRNKFDNESVTFDEHRRREHNWWHYLCFIVWLQIKDPTEYTGPESYVSELIKIKERATEWFPHMQAMSLTETTTEADDAKQMQAIHDRLAAQDAHIKQLATAVDDLKQMMQTSLQRQLVSPYQRINQFALSRM